jgi:hypothetical protein
LETNVQVPAAKGNGLRDYQERTVSETLEAWEAGKRRVCVVLPTGGGKTRVGQELVACADEPRTLWVAHRKELVQQAAERLREHFGHLNVGIIAAGQDASPYAPIQVASIQTLIAREQRPEASLVVFDECHHIKAATYKELADYYADSIQLGLTATPERKDGSPLGDMYDHLVVGAQYSELIAQGHLVDCRVFQPPEIPGSSSMALEPLKAYQAYAPGTRAFAFAPSVALAEKYAAEFRAAGIPSLAVDAQTPAAERHAAVESFRAGSTRVLWNVYLFTEGTDVPAAETALLARGCGHGSMYLQIVGRVLRPFPGKGKATLIDLSGASLIHGFPTEDRIYSLDGSGIKRTSLAALKVCGQCGSTILSAYQVCPNCGFNFPRNPTTDPRIYDWALKEVFAGSATPDDAKNREWQRLRQLCKDRDWGISWAIKEYKKLFGGTAPIGSITDDEWRDEYRRLVAFGASRNYKPGFAKVRFKELSGNWPPRGWS